MASHKIEDLNELQFDASEVAQLAGVKDTKTIANWTDRGLADPYRHPSEWRRGRGFARRYSLRDALHFALVAELVDRWQIPIPLGRQLCILAFSDPFPRNSSRYLLIDRVRPDHAAVHSLTPEQLIGHLSSAEPGPCLVFSPGAIYCKVKSRAETLRNGAGNAGGVAPADS